MTNKILAPLPGIFYRRPSPSEPPFVEENGKFSAGATIGLIEAMKSFIPVETETEGTLIRFLVADGDAVDTDDPIAEWD